MRVAAPAMPVAANVAVPAELVADMVLAPAVVPSVHAPTDAIPDPFVVAVAPVTEPPPDVTANVTLTPPMGLPFTSFTITLGATGTDVFTLAVWLLPPFTAIVPAP